MKRRSHTAYDYEGLRNRSTRSNTLNKKLIKENVGFRKEIFGQPARRTWPEEKAAELDNKVSGFAGARARDIRLGLSASQQTRIEGQERRTPARRFRARSQRTGYPVSNKAIYVRVLLLPGRLRVTTEVKCADLFEFEGERLSYSAMREVDYQTRTSKWVSIQFDRLSPPEPTQIQLTAKAA